MTIEVGAVEAISAIANVVAAIAVVAATFAAFKGLRIWKRDLRARTELDVARPILKKVYALRGEFKPLRSVISRGPPNEQFDQFNKIKNELADLLLDAEVLWGDRLATLKAKLRELINQFGHALDVLGDPNSDKTPAKYRDEADAIRYGKLDGTDQFWMAFMEVIDGFEQELRPCISRAIGKRARKRASRRIVRD